MSAGQKLAVNRSANAEVSRIDRGVGICGDAEIHSVDGGNVRPTG